MKYFTIKFFMDYDGGYAAVHYAMKLKWSKPNEACVVWAAGHFVKR
jgi:hypothetical protein